MNVRHLESPPHCCQWTVIIQESVVLRRLVLVCFLFEVCVQIRYSCGRWRHNVLELALSSNTEGQCCDGGHGLCQWYFITADVYV
jgi:hypothetical protein